jgi:hypothetical protein
MAGESTPQGRQRPLGASQSGIRIYTRAIVHFHHSEEETSIGRGHHHLLHGGFVGVDKKSHAPIHLSA